MWRDPFIPEFASPAQPPRSNLIHASPFTSNTLHDAAQNPLPSLSLLTLPCRWRVVSIPISAWQKLHSVPEKQSYLLNHVLVHIEQYGKFKG